MVLVGIWILSVGEHSKWIFSYRYPKEVVEHAPCRKVSKRCNSVHTLSIISLLAVFLAVLITGNLACSTEKLLDFQVARSPAVTSWAWSLQWLPYRDLERIHHLDLERTLLFDGATPCGPQVPMPRFM